MDKGSSSRTATTVIACGAACLLTSVATLLIARQFAQPALCSPSAFPALPRLSFPKEETEWDRAVRLNIDEYNVTAMITENSERCYIQPLNRNGERRALRLIGEPLSSAMIEQVGGVSALHFCEGLPTYLLQDIAQVHQNFQTRQKRQSNIPDDLVWGGDLEYDARSPRCMNLVLDCGLDSNIGQGQKCFTWINGVMLMNQVCEAPNKFSIHMTKPPGRMLKIAQRQTKECLIRRQSGQPC